MKKFIFVLFVFVCFAGSVLGEEPDSRLLQEFNDLGYVISDSGSIRIKFNARKTGGTILCGVKGQLHEAQGEEYVIIYGIIGKLEKIETPILEKIIDDVSLYKLPIDVGESSGLLLMSLVLPYRSIIGKLETYVSVFSQVTEDAILIAEGGVTND